LLIFQKIVINIALGKTNLIKMKHLKSLAIVTIAGSLAFSSCDLVKDIDYKIKDNPLQMHGDTVELVINGTFKEKGIHKKAVVEVTPVLIGKDGQEYAFKMEKFQGFKAADNGIVIPKEGGSFKYTSKIAYNSNLEHADLKVKVLPKKGTKTKDLIVTDKIADATIVTPLLVMSDDKVILGKDAFVRVTSHDQVAVINYEKNQSNVRPAELRDQDVKDFETFVAKAINPDSRITLKGVHIKSYASPEGEMDLNTNLANERANTGRNAVAPIFNKLKVEAAKTEGFYTLDPKGEDWDGFKTEVEKTTHADKDLILRVLQMTSDPAKRELEIRNMAKTYEFLEKSVLPQLRRSQVALKYDLTGKTDEELTALAKSNPDSLKLEEILFAATLTDDLNEKLRIYKEAQRIYPDCWRAANNVGYVQMLMNNLTDAEASFKKAASIKETTIVKNNLGVVARLKGDRNKAMELYGEAAGAGDEVNYNKGIINIQDGKYTDAIANFGNNNTFNKALAQVLNGDYDAALKTIDASADKDSAMGYYLKAIVGARTMNTDLMMNNLKSAIGKDASLKAKAKGDREFVKFFGSSDFTAIVG
jgi:Flp pilus assembly protein TadD